MKITVFQYTVNGLSTFEDHYMKHIESLIDEFKISERNKWLAQNKVKLKLTRYVNEQLLQYEHRYVVDLTDELLTEYLVRFSVEPLELE